MAFVKDNQPELIPQFLHVNAGTVVRRHRHGLNAIRIVADDSCVIVQAAKDSAMPLIHQVPHRRHDERRCSRLLHDRQGDFRFSRAGRHNNATRLTGLQP